MPELSNSWFLFLIRHSARPLLLHGNAGLKEEIPWGFPDTPRSRPMRMPSHHGKGGTQSTSPVFPRRGDSALNQEFLQSTRLQERLFHNRQVGGRQNAKAFFKPNVRQRADGLHVGDGFLV